MNYMNPVHRLPGTQAAGLPSTPIADAAVRLSRRIVLVCTLGCVVVAACAWAPGLQLRTPLLPPVLASLLLSLAAASGTWIMAVTRRRASLMQTVRRGWRRWIPKIPAGNPGLVGQASRWPQLVAVGGLAGVAAAISWLPLATALPTEPRADLMLGIAVLVLAFPFLVTQRIVATVPAPRLPEAVPLRSLLLLPVLTLAGAGLFSLVAGLGIPLAARLGPVLGLPLTMIAVELVLRAAGRCFLPPPPPDQAIAAIDSALASILADGVQTQSITNPIRRHLGIDFNRSWALAFLRAAVPLVLLGLALLSWTLSGLALVGTDQRAVYERFGAPVQVLHPGLHLLLPWPMGKARTVEFGTMHDVTLMGADTSLVPEVVGAEDVPPATADRLWEQAHPGELIFLIASRDNGRDSFQAVSADIKLRYRVGLTDRDAILAAYGTVDPATALQASAVRLIGGFLASRTLDAVLGENRETMADSMRQAIQQDLDRIGCGLDLTTVVIEAIHPPAGAAEAYHNVQSAEIQAFARISLEQGRAFATQSKALQDATAIVTQAQGSASEVVGGATSDATRFEADHASAQAHGESFLLERRLSDIAAGLAKSATTIIDDRIPVTDPAVLDLRPLGSPAVRSAIPPQD